MMIVTNIQYFKETQQTQISKMTNLVIFFTKLKTLLHFYHRWSIYKVFF